jgi:SAM-dependent methyltransferase
MSDPLPGDVIGAQYTQWVYPKPIPDLAKASFNLQVGPRPHFHVFWPDRPFTDELDILVGGCGANQAAVLAYTHPGARITAVDISKTALDHEDFLKRKHGLENLELLPLAIENVGKLNRDFDLIISTGVLHHMADPVAGMMALGRCLRPDAVFAVMLYAKYGRVGVEMMQRFFRLLGAGMDRAGVDLAKEALTLLKPWHPVREFMRSTWDLDFDAGIVDQFLNARAVNYSVDDCFAITERASLVFQAWLEPGCYHPETYFGPHGALYQAMYRLDPRRMWAAMEIYNTLNATHVFCVCRPDRDPSTYRLSFDRGDVLGYIPVARPNVAIREEAGRLVLASRTLDCPISQAQQVAFKLVDGKRRGREIALAMKSAGVSGNEEQVETFAFEFLRSLWRLGFVDLRF